MNKCQQCDEPIFGVLHFLIDGTLDREWVLCRKHYYAAFDGASDKLSDIFNQENSRPPYGGAG